MKDFENVCENTNNEAMCNSRREFLVKATATAGGLVLALSGLQPAGAQEKKSDNSTAKSADGANEVVLKLNEKSPLNKVGGFDTVETSVGKVVIVRIGETDFKAYSAVCTHKGGPIKYDEKARQLFCPLHGSRFDMTGAVVKGPATKPLATYETEKAVVVALKNKG